MMQTIKTKIAQNTIIQMAYKLVVVSLGLITIALITRYLGRTGFGIYTTIFTFLQFAGILADLGLSLVTTQMISDRLLIGNNKEKINNVFSNIFTFRFFSALFFLILTAFIIWFIPYPKQVKIGVAIMSIAFFFIILNQVMIGLFQKELRMDKAAISEIVKAIILVCLVGIAVYFNLGLYAILIASVISCIISFFINYYLSKKFIYLKFNFNLYLWKEIIKRSWPLALSIGFNLIYLKADIIILSLVRSQRVVGLYGASYKIIDVLTMLPMMIMGLILPIATTLWTRHDRKSFKKILQKTFDIMSIISLPLIIGGYFLSKKIMIFIAGKKFAMSGYILQILILGAVAIFFSALFGHIIIAINKQKQSIGAYAFVAITSLLGYLIFIPKYSYFGAAWVTVYSEVITAVLTFFIIYKYTKFVPSFRTLPKIIFSCLLMGLFLFYFKNFNLIIQLFIAALIYFIGLIFTKGLKTQEIKEVIKFK